MRLWLLGVLVLAGCATGAQRQYQAIATGNKAIAEQAQGCMAGIYAAPEADALRAKWPADARDASLGQLADTALATPAEINSITVLHPRLKACQKAILNGLMTTMPGLVPIMTRQYAALDDGLLALIQRRTTWGEFSKGRRDRAATLLAAAQAEASRVTAGLEQQHEAELQRRQAAAQALSEWAQTQQVINAMNRPVNTTCFGGGGMVNCTTR